MKRNIDLHCGGCGSYITDRIVAEDEVIRCDKCKIVMDHVWWARRARSFTEWPESEAAVVFENPHPTDERSRFSFPAINTKPCPPGWIKHTARSDQQMAKLERMTNTHNESRWYDKGTARGFDDYLAPMYDPTGKQ